MERLAHNHVEDTAELLSSYVDGAVDIAERRRAESYIERCPACAQDARELRTIKAMLREVPNVQPRRSFTLDPATAPQPRRLLFPTLRWATFAAAMVLLLVLGVDGLGSWQMGQGGGAATTSADTPGQRTMQSANMPAGGNQAFSAAAASTAASTAAAAAASAPAPSAESAVAAASAAAATEASAAASEAAAVVEASAAAATGAASSAAASAAPSTGDAASQAPAVAAVPNVLSTTGPAQGQVELGPAGGTGGASEFSAQSAASASTAPQLMAQPVPQANQPGVNTLRIAEIVLAIVALGFGAATWWAWRRQI